MEMEFITNGVGRIILHHAFMEARTELLQHTINLFCMRIALLRFI